MKQTLIASIYLALSSLAFGQDKVEKQTAAIVAEGKLLYRSEMASWYGTDIFLERFSHRQENIGGYFSYNENALSKCIFFSKDEDPKVIGMMTFDSTYNVETAMVDSTVRAFTKNENDIYLLRKNALAEINKDKSDFFKMYKNTNLNLIPLILNGERKVFVLTGPKVSGVVIFGNDYLLTFDSNNKLKSKKQLHQNLITIEYSKDLKEGEKEAIAIHSHLPKTGDFITSTDICTLMLYENFAKWSQHIVISKKYVCLWDCKKDQLVTISKKVWDRIVKDQEKRNPEK